MNPKFPGRIRFLFAAFLSIHNLLAQTQPDSVDVTFFYIASGNPSTVYLPGEFNNWGPNSNGFISPNAPARMNFDATTGRWFKTVRLRVGGPDPLPDPRPGKSIRGAYQYKFNENGVNTGWLSDPLNPRRNPTDNDNSILYVNNPTIHYLLPNSLSGIVNEQPLRITAYIFSSTKDAVDPASIRLVVNSTEYTDIDSAYDPAIKFFSFVPPQPLTNGTNRVKLFVRSVSGSQSGDSTTFSYAVNPPLVVEPLPAGVVDGINYVNQSTVTLSLFAPRKKFVYVIGDFNDWKIAPAYFMKITPDSSHFWITLNGLAPNNEYLFQYWVDGKIRIADSYTEKISDPQYDRFISDSTYPNLIPYPIGKTEEIASVLQTAQTPDVWQVTDFERPAPKDLVIYELLIRDFIGNHDYKTLIDSLNYFAKLGVNAIELMPIMEFEGNESWGYNPSFYFAPDKYYGPNNDLKRFIDECHKRGIAVILDIVLNHSFGQSPFVRLYSQGPYGPPTPDNPWFNVTATHPFSVGYDFNHESQFTKALVDRVNAYWLTEYRVDGYRFDLSKGFTQRYSGADVDYWGSYDASRIAILKRMADKIWEVDSTAYIILEHFAENREEKELAEYRRGIMLWGNMNYNYNEATMGYHENGKSDFSWGAYTTRGWSKPHLVTYMESHDEERLMFKNIRYGNRSGNYNIQDTTTALNRMKLAAAFFFTIPGPKMMWQFGELGYDYSIDYNGRLGNKPIRWDYLRDPRRKNLYKVFAALIKLKTQNEAFGSSNFSLSLRDPVKRIGILHSSMNVIIIGNFDVVASFINPNFPNTGKWYDYFSGDSLVVTDPQAAIFLQPGEFHIYTTAKLETPERGIITEVEKAPVPVPYTFALEQNFPNPFNPETTIRFELPQPAEVTLRIFNLLGEEVITLAKEKRLAGPHSLVWNGRDAKNQPVASGIYLLRLEAENRAAVRKIVVVR
jgi:1,4-alpha-glucan branching enzyme